ncbi:hypothetical protein [Paenibacillus sp. RC67]|uniref:hypothetical protein n=1 Tax=Paenibacillus sp. RC67 TaxID=3039392 RepID=UPI0024AE2C25|nr:hypothetical protein [Paenibacillus sp. RC67]
MLHKGLWFQNYKQTKYVLWCFWLVAVMSGVQFYNHAVSVSERVRSYMELTKKDYPFQYNFTIDLQTVSALQLLLCIVLAAFLSALAERIRLWSLPTRCP